jgi:hypothetical protein
VLLEGHLRHRSGGIARRTARPHRRSYNNCSHCLKLYQLELRYATDTTSARPGLRPLGGPHERINEPMNYGGPPRRPAERARLLPAPSSCHRHYAACNSPINACRPRIAAVRASSKASTSGFAASTPELRARLNLGAALRKLLVVRRMWCGVVGGRWSNELQDTPDGDGETSAGSSDTMPRSEAYIVSSVITQPGAMCGPLLQIRKC